MITLILIPFIFSFLFGFFDAYQTIAKDCPDDLIFDVDKGWLKEVGGNKVWNPSYEWTSGCKHQCKHGWLWSYSLTCVYCAFIFSFFEFNSLWSLVYLGMGKFEGYVFILFYHNILRKNNKQNLIDLLLLKIKR